jgi:hypothetical protein
MEAPIESAIDKAITDYYEYLGNYNIIVKAGYDWGRIA